jgi:hypothetical protein
MSDERGFGIDMVPLPIPEFARVHEEPVAPVTEAERDESVNADILRRACHVRIDELITHVRRLDPRGAIVVANIVRLAAQDLEGAVERYIGVERKFRQRRQ